MLRKLGVEKSTANTQEISTFQGISNNLGKIELYSLQSPCFSTYILLYFTWLLSPFWQLVLKGLWFRKSQWFEWCWHLFNWRRSNKLENLGQGEVRSRFSRVNVPIYRRESRSSPSMGGGGVFPTPFTLLSLAPKVLHPECFLLHWNFNIELNIKVDPW